MAVEARKSSQEKKEKTASNISDLYSNFLEPTVGGGHPSCASLRSAHLEELGVSGMPS